MSAAPPVVSLSREEMVNALFTLAEYMASPGYLQPIQFPNRTRFLIDDTQFAGLRQAVLDAASHLSSAGTEIRRLQRALDAIGKLAHPVAE